MGGRESIKEDLTCFSPIYLTRTLSLSHFFIGATGTLTDQSQAIGWIPIICINGFGVRVDMKVKKGERSPSFSIKFATVPSIRLVGHLGELLHILESSLASVPRRWLDSTLVTWILALESICGLSSSIPLFLGLLRCFSPSYLTLP